MSEETSTQLPVPPAHIIPLPEQPPPIDNTKQIAEAAACPHMGPFTIKTDVRRDVEHGTGKVRWTATFMVSCAKCNLPMAFKDVPMPPLHGERVGPTTDAIGLTLVVEMVQGREAFEHFMASVGKTSPLAPAGAASDTETQFSTKPRAGRVKLSDEPGTRPTGPQGESLSEPPELHANIPHTPSWNEIMERLDANSKGGGMEPLSKPVPVEPPVPSSLIGLSVEKQEGAD